MTLAELKEKLPNSWKVIKTDARGEITVESDERNLIVAGNDPDWILRHITAIMLSHR